MVDGVVGVVVVVVVVVVVMLAHEPHDLAQYKSNGLPLMKISKVILILGLKNRHLGDLILTEFLFYGLTRKKNFFTKKVFSKFWIT